jgi:hypothetical protein
MGFGGNKHVGWHRWERFESVVELFPQAIEWAVHSQHGSPHPLIPGQVHLQMQPLPTQHTHSTSLAWVLN